MFKLDDNLLQELGLGSLPPAEKNKMLAHIYETLEMRVGMRLAEQMSNDQLDEFERFIDANDEAGALKWLETNFPNYKDVVAEELERLKTEIKAAAPQIVGASQQMQPATPQQPTMPTAQPPADWQQPPQTPPAAPQQ
jgi:predicted RNA-binding Zn ribbon-like protein